MNRFKRAFLNGQLACVEGVSPLKCPYLFDGRDEVDARRMTRVWLGGYMYAVPPTPCPSGVRREEN